MRCIALFLVFAAFSFAQPLSLGKPNEEKEHSPWLNAGFGMGILSPVNKEYKEQGKAFVNPSILLNIQFAYLSAVTLEFDCTAPHGGWGGWFGFEQQFMQRDISPFAEAQIGARYTGKSKRGDASFGDVFGAAAGANAGIVFFRESQFRIRLRGGYEWVFNDASDMSWSAGLGFLFAIGHPGLETIKVD